MILKGRTGQITEPKAEKGKWVFEISVWHNNNLTQLHEPYISPTYFDTEEEAKAALMVSTKFVTEMLEKAFPDDVEIKHMEPEGVH